MFARRIFRANQFRHLSTNPHQNNEYVLRFRIPNVYDVYKQSLYYVPKVIKFNLQVSNQIDPKIIKRMKNNKPKEPPYFNNIKKLYLSVACLFGGFLGADFYLYNLYSWDPINAAHISGYFFFGSTIGAMIGYTTGVFWPVIIPLVGIFYPLSKLEIQNPKIKS